MVTDISDISDIFSLQASSAYEVLSDEVERKAYAIGQVDHWSCCPAEFSCSHHSFGGVKLCEIYDIWYYIYDIIWFSDKLWWEMRHEKKGMAPMFQPFGVRLHAEDRELRAEYLRMVKLQPKPKPKCKP